MQDRSSGYVVLNVAGGNAADGGDAMGIAATTLYVL